ncbi:MAG: hypothetical protein HC789_04465 [Microcoleus sp. CSU_2_2]|nr:hypothetical protein [Microcoleus sp. SU_5_3]NJS09681.1 hypothetical protein [Microcoleus sp. CSU_2_2]
MKKLEFLLQKEGDRAWLPLETADVEILEGRYRVVARIPHPNTNIEIRVTYTSFDEVSPQRQAQSRSARTNPEGLVVIIPYTRLKPGIWELSCLPDPRSNPAKPWQHGVQLEVLPAESETSEPLQPLDEAEPANSAADSQLAAAVDATTQPIAAAGDRYSQNPVPAAQPEPQAPKIYQFPTPQTPQPSPEYKLQLVLDRETFVAQLGRPLIISGKIDIPQPPPNPRKPPTPIPDSQAQELKKLIGSAQLQIYLRDPQTSQLLAEIQQPLPEQVPPCIFACVTYIPAECKSRLILGEAVFSSDSTPPVTQFFTITARLERLLEVIEDNFTAEKHQAEPSAAGAKPPSMAPNLSFLKLVKKRSHNPSPSESATNESLPPQLSSRPASNQLELPTFGRKLPDSSRAQLLSEISNTAQTSALSIDSPTKPSDIPNSEQTPELGSIDPQPETVASEPESAPTKEAFQTLNVENRFWSRLSSLASTNESPEWLKETLLSPTKKAAVNSSDAIATVPESISPTQQPAATSDSISDSKSSWEAREVVIFDEPSPPQKVALQDTKVQEEATPLTPYILPEDDLVPMPILKLPRDEILAGRAVKVRVELPELMPRIYVKIWVYDRQTYLILDGPHWITEFTANGLGTIQSSLELEIPYGCMEVEFEAIAVEMQTQRESHKVTVHRQVLPPSGPTLPLDS